MSPESTNILIATCGNLMASSDAFGPMVARSLRYQVLPGAELVDLDIRPAALMDHLPGRTGLILVDALYAPDREPGRVLDLDWFDPGRPQLVNDDSMSTHGLSLAMQLELAGQVGMLPPFVRLIGMTINHTPGVGQTACPGILHAVVTAVDLIHMHLEDRSPTPRELEHA